MSEEEIVRVDLGDDYYLGPYFSTTGARLDYEVPRSQLKRWEAAQAIYQAMQGEIEHVMQEQGNRVLALHLERRKGQPSGVPPAVQEAYEKAITQMLQQSPLSRKGSSEQGKS